MMPETSYLVREMPHLRMPFEGQTDDQDNGTRSRNDLIHPGYWSALRESRQINSRNPHPQSQATHRGHRNSVLGQFLQISLPQSMASHVMVDWHSSGNRSWDKVCSRIDTERCRKGGELVIVHGWPELCLSSRCTAATVARVTV